jgi:hypothetical protein
MCATAWPLDRQAPGRQPKRRKTDVAERLLAAAARGDPVAQIALETCRGRGAETGGDCWALRLAAHNGHELSVRALLDARIDPNASQAAEWTALVAAARRGHARCFALLQGSGADVDKGCKVAAYHGHDECLERMLQCHHHLGPTQTA